MYNLSAITTSLKNTRGVPKLHYDDAALLVVSLGVETYQDIAKCKKQGNWPPVLPSQLDTFYTEYTSFDDFIAHGKSQLLQRDGCNNIPSIPHYEQLKNKVSELGITSQDAYRKAVRGNKLFTLAPFDPKLIYAEFTGWDDFLPPKIEYLDFEDARDIARQLQLKSSYDWVKLCRNGQKPARVSSIPHQTYAEQWVSWDDFLGIKRD